MTPSLWFFRALNLHERVPSPVLQALQSQGRLERWGHQAQIFCEQEPGRVYIVLRGGVFLHDGTPAQRVRLRAGDLFGALPHGPDEVLPAHADVSLRRQLRAFDDTTLVSLERADLQDLILPHLSHVEAAVGGLRHLRRRRSYRVPLSPLLASSPTSRFARTIVHLAESEGRLDGDRGALDFPFEPHQISPLLGLDRQRSQAVADQLMRRGLIQNEPDRLVIPSMDALRAAALGSR